MRHLILSQGKAQAEMHSRAGTGLRHTTTRRTCSCRTWLRPTSFLSHSLGPKELHPRLQFSLLLQHSYFLVSAFSCPEDTGSALAACVHLGKRAICHCQEMCCTQQVSFHLPLLLQRGLQILRRCITCTLQTAIHHCRAVPQTPRHNPASCSACLHWRGTSCPAPGYLTMRDEQRCKKQGAMDYGFCCKNDILSLSSPERPSDAKVAHNH